MYCCNLLKPDLSVTLQDKFLGMGILHPHHSQLQASTRTWATWAARRKIQLHTWKTSLSVCASTDLQPPSWSKPFIHLPATNSCQEAPIPASVQAIGLPWRQGSAKQSPSAILPLALTRTSCDRDWQKERLWKHAPACQESTLHPTPLKTYTHHLKFLF